MCGLAKAMVILVVTGIQSPFPHPSRFACAGMFRLSLSQKSKFLTIIGAIGN